MAKQEDEHVVLLGTLKQNKAVNDSCPFMCKAGGQPAWMGSIPIENEKLICGNCKSKLYQMAQVYAPVEFERTLYVFGCVSMACIEKPKSWRVFRSQLEMVAVKEVDCGDQKRHVQSSGWSDDDDDDDEWGNDNPWTQDIAAVEDCEQDLQSLLLERDENISVEKKVAAKKLAADGSKPKEVLVGFPAIFMEVEEEPMENSSLIKDFSHEDNLFKKYLADEQEEGNDISNLQIKGQSGNAKSGVSGEKYERESAKEKAFNRFQERIRRCPMQCLRYDYGGEPLWPAPPPKDLNLRSLCACGQARVFEMQLMPSLNFFLKVDQYSQLHEHNGINEQSKADQVRNALDWGTVVVFSCPQSCDKSNEEVIYIQPLKD